MSGIELPLFWNNDESIRFDFESRSESESAAIVSSVFDDLFFFDSKMFVIFYGSKYTRAGFGKSRYFNPIRMRKIFKQHFISRDKWNYEEDDNPYIKVYKTNRKYFKLNKYLSDYFADDQRVYMAVVSLKKAAALQMYDSRGMDLVINDEVFLNALKQKYSQYMMPKDDSPFQSPSLEDCQKCDKINCSKRVN